MPSLNSSRLRGFGVFDPNNARWISWALKRPARRTTILLPSSSRSNIDPPATNSYYPGIGSTASQMNTFIGVDLGWYGKPSGLGSIRLSGSELRLQKIARLECVDEILEWIESETGSGSAVAAVDA